MAKLSEGAIMKLAVGGEFVEPVVQVLGHKGVVGKDARFRLLISDGKNSITFAMLATQLTPMVTNGELEPFSIIRVNKHVCSMVPGRTEATPKRVVIILDLEVLQKGSEVGCALGNPIPVNDMGVQQVVSSGASASSSTPSSNGVPTPRRNVTVNDTVLNSPTLTSRTHPIDSLSPFQNNWVIKARVATKSPIRTWSNAKGEGRLFNVDLVDSSGEIRATGFKESVDKFYDILQEGKIFLISKCTLKIANKKYSSLNNAYEMTFTGETKIVPCEEDDQSIPTLKFDFKLLTDVLEAEVQSMIDVIGVCKSVGDVTSLTSKTTQRELKKRDLTLVDQSLAAVTLTLWGIQAEEFDGSTQPVIAVKGARINEFMGGKSLGLIGGSAMQLNPDIPEAHRLRAWYDSLNEETKFNSISTRIEGGGSDGKFLVMKEAINNKLGTGDKPDYFNCYATIMTVRSDRSVYKACPSPDCNKKVVDQNTGQYRCEKCNREYDNFKYRLMLSANISDFSGHTWISLFQEQAEQLLGAKADDVGRWQEEDSSRFNDVFTNVAFKDFQFRLRAKVETYNDEQKLKVTAYAAKPVDYAKRCNYLISEIRNMAGIEAK